MTPARRPGGRERRGEDCNLNDATHPALPSPRLPDPSEPTASRKSATTDACLAEQTDRERRTALQQQAGSKLQKVAGE